MKDIKIKISKESRMVYLSKSRIGNEAENLQGNLVFSFKDEFVNGQARLELTIDGQDSWIPLLKEEETYYCPIKSAITKKGQIDMQLVITENEDEEGIPIFKSNVFYMHCDKSINAEIEQPEEYPTWIEIANEKLNEMDNLDIDAEKVEDTTTITITKKDGTEQSVEVKDGADGIDGQDGVSLEYNWQDTSLGIKREDEADYNYVDLKGDKGDKGDPGSIKMRVVQTLPATGDEDTIYLVPSTDPATQNLYDEYIYTNNAWEKIGNTSVDLSDYATIDDITVEFNDGSQSYTWETSQDMFNYIATNFGGALNQIFEDLDNKQSKNLMIQSINEYSSSSSYPSGSAVYDYGNVVVDLTGTTIGTLITDTTLVSKLLDDRCIIKYENSNYRFARLQDGVIRLYTVMDNFTSGKYIALVNQNGSLLFYETGSTSWEVPSNKVTSLSSSSTDTQYPSAKCVYDALQNAGGGDSYYLGEIKDFTQNNPIDLTNMETGIYYIKVENILSGNKNIYLKATVNGNDITGTYTVTNSYNSVYMNYIALHIDKKISDITVTSSATTFGNMEYIIYQESGNVYLRRIEDDLKISTSGITNSNSYSTISIVTRDNAETISGKKTFSTIPELSSGLTPTTDYQLVNKKYVDDNAGGGENYFVKPTHSFVDLDTADVQAIIDKLVEINNDQTYLMSSRTGYRATDITTVSLDQKLRTSVTSYLLNVYNFGTNINVNAIGYGYYPYNVTISWNGDVPTVTRVTQGTMQTTTIPLNGNTSSWTPSTNYSPVHKKYVDDKPKSYTGYDATKTQVLKNVNGTLTWVDET